MGGPTKYVYREGSGLTDAFVSDEVCPHICAKFGSRVAVVLGKSLLWVCKEPEMIPQVPACLRQRVIQAYEGVMQLEENINPIEKRRIVVYNVGGQLRIDKEVTEFRRPLQVQSHLEMPRILVQLGHTQRTWKLAPQTDPKWSPTRSSTPYQDQMSVKCTRRTLRMPSFTRAPHAQPSLSNFT